MLNLQEYFKTTFENKLLFKMLQGEDDHLTPATRLLEKCRELAETEHVLSVQKEEFETKMKALQQRRKMLEKKEKHLKESLEKFDKFLKENDSKRIRAIKKANELREQKKMKITHLEKFTNELKILKIVFDHLIRKQNKYQKYLVFMKRLLNCSEEFQEIRDIVLRYDTLVLTQRALVTTNNENQELTEHIKKKIHNFIEEKYNEILAYHNQHNLLELTHEAKRNERYKLSAQMIHIENTANKYDLMAGKIKMAIFNLYNITRMHEGYPAIHNYPEVNSFEQLRYVRQFGEELVYVTNSIPRDKKKFLFYC